ncbi:MAG: hypothetical protein HYZ83_03935 [Candidatus Omnitrophica bacterium]|nr:hypothetical protein [Candidatus Omnitrophota bacterium]
MKEEPRKRLGHLAADFLRIANFIESGSANEAKPIFRESKWFAEWIAPEVDLETQELLVNAQSFLALKEIQWLSWIQNEREVRLTVLTARNWSDEFLKRAGF